MVKFILTAIAFLLLTLTAFTPLTFAQENVRAQEVSTLDRNEVIEKDYFAMGEKVTLSGTVEGDAYLAGGNIIVDGIVKGDLLVAGGNINITGSVLGDVRLAGGNVTISGSIGENVSGVAGNIQLAKSGQILGNLVAGGGNVEVFGPVNKGLTVGSGALTIASSIGEDVLTATEDLSLTSTATVSGDLTYYSELDADISQDATISGKVSKMAPPIKDVDEKSVWASIATTWAIYSFLSSLVLGLLFILVFPNFTQKTSQVIKEKPWVSLGLGFLFMIVVPFIILLLMFAVIGIPLAILLLVSFIFLMMFAHIFSAVTLGNLVLNKFNWKNTPFLSLILGLLILSILGLIPIIGFFISFSATLLGLGAYLISKRSTFLALRTKKVI